MMFLLLQCSLYVRNIWHVVCVQDRNNNTYLT